MSRTIIVLGHFGTGKTMRFSLSQLIEEKLAELRKVRRSFPRYMCPTVLDIMRENDRAISSFCIEKNLTDFARSERFSRRCIPYEVGSAMAALSYLPAHICIYGRTGFQYVSLWICGLKQDRRFCGKDAMEKQSNELLNLSIPRTHLWRDRRRRRKRKCDVWGVPWKLNSDWIYKNAWVRSVSGCA